MIGDPFLNYFALEHATLWTSAAVRDTAAVTLAAHFFDGAAELHERKPRLERAHREPPCDPVR